MPLFSFLKKPDETPVSLNQYRVATANAAPVDNAQRTPEFDGAQAKTLLRDAFTSSDSCAPRPVWLYGLDDLCNIAQYSRHDFRGIAMMTYYADELRKIKPHITEIYAVDGNAQLSDYFKKAFRNPSFDSRVCFRDYLQSAGLLVWKKA